MPLQANINLAGSSSLESAQRGMERGAEAIKNAAEVVLEGTVETLNGGGSIRDTVTLSEEARSKGGLESAFVQSASGQLVYGANLRVVAATEDRFAEMVDIATQNVR